MKVQTFIMLYFFSLLTMAQEMPQKTNTSDFNVTKSSGTRDFKKSVQEEYGYQGFFQEFRINDAFLIRAELWEMRTAQATTFELPIMIKHRVTEQFSLLFGPKIDAVIGPSGSDVGFSIKAGVQYDLTKHWCIEAGFEYQLKSAFPQGHYKYGNKGSFYFGTGVKF